MAAAYELSTSSNDNSPALARILKRTKNLADVSAADPATAHRLISGLSSLNDQLHEFTAPELRSSKVRVDSIDALITKIRNSDRPIVVTYRDSGNSPHTISISKIKAPARSNANRINSGFLVADTNLGFIPCEGISTLKNILQTSAQRYLGTDISAGINYDRLSMSAFEFDSRIKGKFTFGMQSGVPTGPYATHTRRGGDDYYSYKHLFGEEAPGWSLFAKAHDTSSSSAWARLLPAELGQRAVQGDHNIGAGLKITTETSAQAAMTTTSDQVLEQMRLLSSQTDVACSLGKCSIEMRKYLEPEVVRKKANNDGSTQASSMRPADGDVIYADLQIKPASDSGEFFPHLRHRGPGAPPALELELDLPPQVPPRSQPAPPQNPKPKLRKRPSVTELGDDLLTGLKQLRIEADSSDISAPTRLPPPIPTQDRANPYRRAFDSRYAEQEAPMDLSVKNKPLPPAPGADGPAVPPRGGIAADYRPVSNQQAASNAGNALVGAAMVDDLLNGQPPAPPIRKKAAVKKPASASAHAPMEVDMPPLPPPRGAGAVDDGPPIPARTRVEASAAKTKLKKRGQEFLQERRRPAPAVPGDDISRGTNDNAKPVPLEPASRPSNPAVVEADSDVARMLSEIIQAEDPAVSRMMSQTMEEVRVQTERLHAVSLDVENQAATYMRNQNLNAEDWVIVPAKNNADSITLVYRGSDASVTNKVRNMEMPDSFKQRLTGIQDSFSALKVQIENSPRYLALQAKISQLAQSKGYARFGQVMQMAGKAMSVYNMYTLINEAKELKNLAAHHKVAFALSAADGIFDAASLAVGGLHSLAQLNGVASANLNLASRVLDKVSMGLGLGASVGQSFVHMYSMSLAQTPLEFEISAANTGFSTASVLLTGLMMGFPAAMPVVALFQFAMMGIQYAVIQAIIDKHMREDAAKTLDERWQKTNELLEFVKQIGQVSVKEVSITQGSDGITTIHIRPKAANAKIEITGNKVRIIHLADAYSASYQTNEFREEHLEGDYTDPAYPHRKATKNVKKGAPRIPKGSVSRNHGYHISLFPKGIREGLLKTGCFNSNSFIKELFYPKYIDATHNQKELKAKLGYGKYQLGGIEKNNQVLPCLLLQEQGLFKERLSEYLASETPLFNPPDVIILSEIVPKIELISDVGHYLENEHMKDKLTTHANVNAITAAQCNAKMQSQQTSKQETCEATASVSGVGTSDICKTNPASNWNTKAISYLYPDASCTTDVKNKLYVGDNFVLADHTQTERVTTKAYLHTSNLHPIRERTVTTIPNQVKLTQVPTRTQIDIAKKDDIESIKLIILPEKISTGLMTGTLPFYAFDYGTPENKDKATLLKVNKDSRVEKLMTYQIDLTANQNTEIFLSTGTKTEITEKDNSSNNRVGKYTLALISPNTPEKQQEKINQLEAEKTKTERHLIDERAQLKIKQTNYDNKKNIYMELQKAVNSFVQAEDTYDRTKTAKNEYNCAKNELEEITKKIAGNENRIRELAELIPAENEIKYQPITKLKIKTEYDNTRKRLTLNVNQDSKEYNNIHLAINDLQRNITLVHQEPVEINGKAINFNCVFDIKIEHNQPKLTLNQFGPLNTTDISLINSNGCMEKLKDQLAQNNPAFNSTSFPDSMIVPINLFQGDCSFVGTIDNPTNNRRKRDLNSPASINKNPTDYTGYVMLFNQKVNTNQSNAVSVIYPKSSTQEDVDIYKRLRYLGEEDILSREEVPLEYLTLYDTTEAAQRKVYYLYDEISRTLAKQYMNAAIRKEDMQTCKSNEEPHKFTGRANAAPIYKCTSNNYLDLVTSINECKNKQPALTNLFDFITNKQKTENLPSVLTILNPGVRNENNQTTPLWMEYIGGDTPALMLIKKPENNKKVGIITRNLNQGYAIIAEEIETADPTKKAKLDSLNKERKKNKLPEISEIRISSTKLLKENELEQMGKKLINLDSISQGIPANSLNQIHNLAPNSTITAVLKNPEGGFVLETLAGVAFSLSNDLAKKNLVATNDHYLKENNINSVEDIKSAFITLEQQYGLANAPYIKMSEGGTNRQGQNKPIIFMDTQKKEPLFIPKTDKVSERSYILGSLALNGKTTSLTVADPENRSLITVLEPSNRTNTTQSALFNYGYLQLNQDSISLSLRPTASVQVKPISQASKKPTVELPYLPTQSLYLLPQLEEDNHDHTMLTIPELMCEQVKMITLVPPYINNKGTRIGEAQKISLQSAPNKDIKAFTQEVSVKIRNADGSEEAKTAKRLLIAVPKFILGKDEKSGLKFAAKNTNELSKDYTLINLFEAFDDKGNFTSNFDDCIHINNEPLTHDKLAELVTNATSLLEEQASVLSQSSDENAHQINDRKDS